MKPRKRNFSEKKKRLAVCFLLSPMLNTHSLQFIVNFSFTKITTGVTVMSCASIYN